ncbi:CDP-glycerol glycerophosphotransferase family protein [Streptomyces sp. N35]|uniref:CDP-glycerol glycerophosphotransferase family protein n=1 Tax=Streptomyces sp. N35 TaxID=2795730 RepID=UPI001F2D9BD4|nr:CDP-glycerol glycerophosphotransferase family protein [Streptomyces sp. N35]
MIKRLSCHLKLERDWNLATLTLLLLSFPAMIVGFAAGSGVFIAALAINIAAELVLQLSERKTVRLLGRFHLDTSMRIAIRQALLVVFVATADRVGLLESVGVTLVALHLLRLLHHFGCLVIGRGRRLPLTVRNLNLRALDVPAPAARFLTRNHNQKLLQLDILVAAGVAGVLLTGNLIWTVIGSILALTAAITALCELAPTVVRCRARQDPAAVIAEVNRQLADYQPQVVLYFSFAAISRNFMYQVNSWIETLEQLDKRPLIVLRERGTLAQLGYTRLPVVCVPKADDLARLELPEVRVVLYPGNAGKNVHMLQRAEAKHVFIGHGDSDKAASSNRVSKVYDEIWVAGQAGRDRYERISHAVDHRTIVEVGRPQLAAVAPRDIPRSVGVPTVLYAPTWEGWTDEQSHTSLTQLGETIVRQLLASPTPLRVLYKPHPLIGSRSPEVAAVHRRIVKMLAEANERQGLAALRSRGGSRPLQDIEQRMDRVLQSMKLGLYGDWPTERHQRANPEQAGWNELNQAWHRHYWLQQGPSRHVVIEGQLPHLYDCFNESDLLISDVSSVVSDFVGSEKPYVVANSTDLSDTEFRSLFPVAAAAFVISPADDSLGEALESIRHPDDDPLLKARTDLRQHLLGPDLPSAVDRFNAAVNSLYLRGLDDAPTTAPLSKESHV